jgi:phosphatidylinositol glycan class B
MAETKPPQTRNDFQNLNATRIFLFVCIYRLANALVIRTQFDPDEYWQTLEPAYCLAFGSKEHELQPDESETSYGCALTWEWTRRWTPSNETSEENMPAFLLQAMHGPIRSYVSILPTYWYYLACKAFLVFAERNFCEYLKQFVQRNVSYIISKGPALLHAVTIAAPTDLSVWLVALRLESLNGAFMKHKSISWSSWALILSLTSWFNGYALIRTYANCFETVCLAVGLVLLGPVSFMMLYLFAS